MDTPWFIWFRDIRGPSGEQSLMVTMPDAFFEEDVPGCTTFFDPYPSKENSVLGTSYDRACARLIRKVHGKLPLIKKYLKELTRIEHHYTQEDGYRLLDILDRIVDDGLPGKHQRIFYKTIDRLISCLKANDGDVYEFGRDRRFYWTRRTFDFIHRTPIEDVPPLISDPSLGALAQCRLKIGK